MTENTTAPAFPFRVGIDAESHPSAGCKLPRKVPSPLETLSVFRAFGSGHAGVRDRAIFVLLWRGALRISEVLALDAGDLDLAQGLVTLRTAKRGSVRTVGLDPLACSVVAAWVERRKRLGLTARHPLFCTFSRNAFGRRVDRRTYWEALRRAADEAGIVGRFHPHALRHAGAVDLLEEGFDLEQLREILGHSSLQVTDRYVRRVDQRDRLRKQREREWPVVPAADQNG